MLGHRGSPWVGRILSVKFTVLECHLGLRNLCSWYYRPSEKTVSLNRTICLYMVTLYIYVHPFFSLYHLFHTCRPLVATCLPLDVHSHYPKACYDFQPPLAPWLHLDNSVWLVCHGHSNRPNSSEASSMKTNQIKCSPDPPLSLLLYPPLSAKFHICHEYETSPYPCQSTLQKKNLYCRLILSTASYGASQQHQ